MAEDEHDQRLRRKAEKLLGVELATLDHVTPDEMRHLLHELQVQNEELRSAQDELKRSRNKYVELYDLAPVGYVTLDGGGVILEANLRAADLLGHPRNHLLRRKLGDFVSVSEVAVFSEHLKVVTNTEGCATCELELVRSDRSRVAAHLETVRTSVGEREGAWELHTSITDITDRKKAEARAREGELFARKINESSLNGIYIYDIEREELVYINQECERLTGYRPADLPTMRGEAFFSLFLPEDRSRVREYITQVGREGDGETREIECRVKTADGRWIWCLSRNAVFERDKQGEARTIIGTLLDLTGRKEAEEALHEHQARLETVFAAIPYALVEYDTNLRPVRANAVALEALGFTSLDFTRDQAAAKLKFTKLDGSQVETETLPTSRALRGEMVADDVYSLTTADGIERVVSAYAVPLYQNGKLKGVVAVWDDITKRKRAEEALRQSREDLDRAQEVGQIGSWRLDVRRNVLTWSDETYRIFGVPKGAPMTYEAFLGLVHPDDRQDVDTKWQACLRGGPYDIEHRIVVGGEVKWVREKAYLEDDAGGLVGGFGISQDITDRKLAEEKLQRAKDELAERVEERTAELRGALLYARSLIEASLDPLVTISREGKITDVNAATETATGRTRKELVGTDFSDYFTEPKDARAGYEQVFREGLVRDYLLELRHRDGHVTPVLYNASLYRDEKGEIVGVFASARDVTERKRAERVVRERTAELAALNEDLMQSRDQLRSLASDLILTEARERRALASELHDTVAQMLAVAKLTLESTGAHLEGKPAGEVKKAVQLIQEGILQTRSLIADLSPSLLYKVGLEEALHALARRMRELHSLAIEVVDDGSAKLLGEDSRVLLFRAVQELLHNVVKHAKATRVKVSLQRAGKHVQVEVEDDGVGFPASARCRKDGIREGFGLFSIRERLQHLGGRFEVFSQPGRGVRAVIVAPLHMEREDEGKEPATVRVLIADDHRMMRDALASLLEKEPGFEVVGLAEDGVEAVRLAHEARPDVVLMDLSMPTMDGIEATRQIKADLPELKVIGLSVEAKDDKVSEMLAAGATSYVPKSSSPEELTEAIRSAVRSGKGI
jgi:PAS domain S-box-containing protein